MVVWDEDLISHCPNVVHFLRARASNENWFSSTIWVMQAFLKLDSYESACTSFDFSISCRRPKIGASISNGNASKLCNGTELPWPVTGNGRV